MSETTVVRFPCSSCGKLLQGDPHVVGSLCRCPKCSAVTKVTLAGEQTSAPPADQEPVPVKLGLRNIGEFQTTVSRQDAGRMSHTFLGGMLTLLVVIVCAVLGINFSRKS